MPEIEAPLKLSDFDYPLPEELIARYPLTKRDQSRMLVVDSETGSLNHQKFHNLPDQLKPGDLVVLNNTRVLPARLLGTREGHSGKVEILLLHPSAEDPLVWSAMMRPAKKLRPGTRVVFSETASIVEILSHEDRGRGQVRIHLEDSDSVDALMNTIGHMPIPPYLNREAEKSDHTAYQTVFAKTPGAQAAPTAGLHFTQEVLERLRNRGVNIAEVTLSVSSGTFRSVDVEDITAYQMDPEHYTLPEETAQAIRATRENGGRIVAIGTTVAKTLETVAAKYNGDLKADSDWSQLFIYPGFEFQVVDVLLTNFHLPKTTLLMLVSAFTSRELILKAYGEAVRERYRFFSYGDCMLLS